MLNHESARKLVAVPIVTLLLATAIVVAVNAIQSAAAQERKTCCALDNNRLRAVPMATSGNNLYMAWPNNDTGQYNVFFAKSTDGGKTLKTMMISAPNKGNTIDLNTQISTSGSNVYVTWWTNKTGTLMPVFRASSDNGDTFAKAITLNSTR
jgi:lipopolysaccharide export LptBFGC system permease protein LptF